MENHIDKHKKIEYDIKKRKVKEDYKKMGIWSNLFKKKKMQLEYGRKLSQIEDTARESKISELQTSTDNQSDSIILDCTQSFQKENYEIGIYPIKDKTQTSQIGDGMVVIAQVKTGTDEKVSFVVGKIRYDSKISLPAVKDKISFLFHMRQIGINEKEMKNRLIDLKRDGITILPDGEQMLLEEAQDGHIEVKRSFYMDQQDEIGSILKRTKTQEELLDDILEDEQGQKKEQNKRMMSVLTNYTLQPIDVSKIPAEEVVEKGRYASQILQILNRMTQEELVALCMQEEVRIRLTALQSGEQQMVMAAKNAVGDKKEAYLTGIVDTLKTRLFQRYEMAITHYNDIELDQYRLRMRGKTKEEFEEGLANLDLYYTGKESKREEIDRNRQWRQMMAEQIRQDLKMKLRTNESEEIEEKTDSKERE